MLVAESGDIYTSGGVQVDRSSEFDQTAVHNHGDVSVRAAIACDDPEHERFATVPGCKTCLGEVAKKFAAEPLPFVPPSQGKRIDEMRRLISQQESDLTEACRHIANQGMTIAGVRADLLGLLNKLRNGVEISYHDIANIIPDSPAEFKKAA